MKMFIAVLMLMLVLPAGAEGLKTGHFDLQRVISQSLAGKEARELYLKKAQAYQDEINRRTAALDKIKDEVKAVAEELKEGASIPPAIIEKDRQAAAQFRDLQRLLGGYQDELKLYDAEMTRSVLLRLQPVLGEFAARNNYDYLYKLGEPLAYANPKRDVTEDLIKAFDKAFRRER